MEHKNDHPTILETRFDSGLYPITRCLWFQDVTQNDKYGYIPQFLQDSTNILQDISRLSNYSDFKDQLHAYKKHSQEILMQNPDFTSVRCYA